MQVVVDDESFLRSEVWPANAAGTHVDDISRLVHLSSATIIDNLRAGLAAGAIYAWVGPVLLAVNPMRPLPALYDESTMEHHRDHPNTTPGADRAAAHPFALAEAALFALTQHGRNSAFVVSGESGAGKTEACRQLLAYWLWRAARDGAAASLAEHMPHVMSVVELFGSAKTVHNGNSSRVGRFLQLQFTPAASSGPSPAGGDPQLVVSSATLSTFLLERSRVVSVPGMWGATRDAPRAARTSSQMSGMRCCRPAHLLAPYNGVGRCSAPRDPSWLLRARGLAVPSLTTTPHHGHATPHTALTHRAHTLRSYAALIRHAHTPRPCAPSSP